MPRKNPSKAPIDRHDDMRTAYIEWAKEAIKSVVVIEQARPDFISGFQAGVACAVSRALGEGSLSVLVEILSKIQKKRSKSPTV